jgi:glutathione peroxidase
MKILATLIVVVPMLSAAFVLAGDTAATEGEPRKDVPAALDFKMKSIQGKEVDLAKYEGKVVLIVNVASKCGYTPQYEGLQALHKTYSEKGLAVLGFPCNQFGMQEPGTESEILSFCKQNYGVEFDMFSKVDVKGDELCGLYKYLTMGGAGKDFEGPIQWNFEKFLVSRDGKVVGRFKSKVAPDAPDFVEAVEKELAKDVRD